MCPQRVIRAAIGGCKQTGHEATSEPQILYKQKELHLKKRISSCKMFDLGHMNKISQDYSTYDQD